MTVLATTISPATSDAELVAASRRGDREAFGRIVRRYQGMVTGLIYAACGDLHRSEDLAQETFVSAWKSLSGLREPGKLPAWLCQVARNRVLDNARSESRRDARLVRAFQNHQEPTAPAADAHLLTEEERDLLWRTLREIAQPYRETMVLYYRQGKSVTDVALAMDTTEANVRQRLSRGREMLREQVAAMLERNLVRSAPGTAFALAVVAALPALIPQTASGAAVAVGAAAVKGTAATAKGTGVLALLAMWIGPIFGILGGAFGTWASIRATEHPRERRFVVRMSVLAWVFVTAAMATLFALGYAQHRFHWRAQTFAIVQCAFWLTYAVLLVAFVRMSNRRQQQIRQEVGLSPKLATVNIAPGRQWLGFVGASVGALAWMLGLAGRAHDTRSMVVVAVAMALLVVLCRRYIPGRPVAQLRRFATVHGLIIGAFTLAMVNWRFHVWIAAEHGITVAKARERIPLWTVDLVTAVLTGFVLLVVRASFPRTSDTTPDETTSSPPSP